MNKSILVLLCLICYCYSEETDIAADYLMDPSNGRSDNLLKSPERMDNDLMKVENENLSGLKSEHVVEEPILITAPPNKVNEDKKANGLGVSATVSGTKEEPKTDNEIEAELDEAFGDGKNLDQEGKHVLAVILKSPKLAAAPEVDLSKIINAGKKISASVAAKTKAAKSGAVSSTGKILTKMVAVPKFIGKLMLKKPLLLAAKKKALLGVSLAHVGKKLMAVGAGVGFIGAKTAGAGVALKGLSAVGLSNIPGFKSGLKAASYIPGLGYVTKLAESGITGALSSGLDSLGRLRHYSNLFLTWFLSDPSDGQVYLVNTPYLDIVHRKS